MIGFEEMLVEPAVQAGIKIPDDPYKYDPEEFPHWTVFCNWQLGRSLPSPDSHFRNAQIIAAVPDDRIKLIYTSEMIDLGAE